MTYLASLSVTSSHLAPTTPPALSVARSGASLVLSWPSPSSGFQLQESAALVPPAWTPVSGSPAVEGGSNKVTVAPNAAARFYRLAKP